MVQRCKFSIELKNFPPDLSGEPFHFYLGSMSKPIQRYNILSDIVCYLLFFGNNFIVDIITSTKALVPNYEGSPTSEFSLMDGLSRVA